MAGSDRLARLGIDRVSCSPESAHLTVPRGPFPCGPAPAARSHFPGAQSGPQRSFTMAHSFLAELSIQPDNSGAYAGSWLDCDGEWLESRSPGTGELIARVKQAGAVQ